jgi:hypothetical protein
VARLVVAFQWSKDGKIDYAKNEAIEPSTDERIEVRWCAGAKDEEIDEEIEVRHRFHQSCDEEIEEVRQRFHQRCV